MSTHSDDARRRDLDGLVDGTSGMGAQSIVYQTEMLRRLLHEIAHSNILAVERHKDAEAQQRASAEQQRQSHRLASQMRWLTAATVALAIIQAAVGILTLART